MAMTCGYDGAAQQFIGLDYFGARYLSSAQGRFTTPDPLHGSAHLEDPQTWNRYSYAANNPLKYNDPAGLWNWDATAGGAYTDEELEERRRNKNLTRRERNEAKNALTFRANFRAARDSAEAAAAASGDVSAQQSVAAWGTENDGNNVSVGWSNQSGSSARVQLLANSDNIVASFNLNLTGNQLAATVAHEGRHVADANTWLIGHFTTGALNMNHYFREMRAWNVSGVIAEALGMKQFAPKGGGQNIRSGTAAGRLLTSKPFAAPGSATF